MMGKAVQKEIRSELSSLLLKELEHSGAAGKRIEEDEGWGQDKKKDQREEERVEKKHDSR